MPQKRSEAEEPALQLVHAGRLSEGKGTFLLIDVCRRLGELGVSYSAKIAGGADDATMSSLKQAIEAAGVQEHLHVLGRVSDDELLALLGKSDVLVHLSQIDSYPLIVLESVAFAVYPICLNLAGARDMVASYTGDVVAAERPAEDTAVLLSRRKRSDMRDDAIRSAKKLRDDYSWANCVKALETALEAVRIGSAR